jgi:DNA replication protein DnaC
MPTVCLAAVARGLKSAWGEIFGDEVTAAAMIDRLVHHAEILALKGDSYRLKDRDLARPARDD